MVLSPTTLCTGFRKYRVLRKVAILNVILDAQASTAAGNNP